MEKIELQQKYDKLRRLHEGANKAIALLQKRLEDMEKEIVLTRHTNENMEKKMLIQKATMTQVILDSNAQNQKQIAEIQELSGVIRELRGD